MELEIDLRRAPGAVRLVDPEELRSFKVVVVEDDAPGRGRGWPEAVARHEEHAWVRIDALRRLAAPVVGPEWEAGFASMIEFARSRGWVDDELGAVRGHVERDPARAHPPG
jgi:hypothetical protein